MMHRILLLSCLALISEALSHGSIRMIKVDKSKDEITIKNYGTDEHAIDISDFALTFQKGIRRALKDLSVISGNLELGKQETLILKGMNLPMPSAGLSFYKSGTTSANVTDPDKMADFIQWGTGGNGREAIAVEKGIWSKGDFLIANARYSYLGDGSENGIQFWSQVLSFKTIKENAFASIKIHKLGSLVRIHLPREWVGGEFFLFNGRGEQLARKSGAPFIELTTFEYSRGVNILTFTNINGDRYTNSLVF